MIVSLFDLCKHLKSHQRLMGLDVGKKTIGLALSDMSKCIASPLRTLMRIKFTKDAQCLVEIIKAHQVCALIVGMPLHMNGSQGKSLQSVRSFVTNFNRFHAIDVAFWDERFSTRISEDVLISAHVSRQKRGAVIDKIAATYILQGALDYCTQRRREAV